jgi:hypothetical protein
MARNLSTDQDFDRAAADVCQEIADLYTKAPEAWTQHAGAVDNRGIPVQVDDPRACAWCAMGAIVRVSRQQLAEHTDHNDVIIVRERAIDRVRLAENARLRMFYTGLHQVNDDAWKTAQDAAEAFRRTAAQLRARATKDDARRREGAPA